MFSRVSGKTEVLDEPLPAVAEPEDLEPVVPGPADDGADDGIQTGAVAAAGQHGDSHERTPSLARGAPRRQAPTPLTAAALTSPTAAALT